MQSMVGGGREATNLGLRSAAADTLTLRGEGTGGGSQALDRLSHGLLAPLPIPPRKGEGARLIDRRSIAGHEGLH